jgi:translation initiation factor IF-3
MTDAQLILDAQHLAQRSCMNERRSSNTRRTRVNEAIRAKEIRLVDADGKALGIVSTSEALTRARSSGLDLVEVAPQAHPPVCRILEYSKWRYQQERQERAQRQHGQETKIIKFGVRIGEGDLETKCRKIREFLAAEIKVRVVISMKGREVTHPELAEDLLRRVDERVSGAARRDGTSRKEGRNIFKDYLPL